MKTKSTGADPSIGPVVDISQIQFGESADLAGLQQKLALLERRDKGSISRHSEPGFQQIEIGVARKTRKTVWDALSERDLWGYTAFTLRVGSVYIVLSYEHLGLSQHTLDRLMAIRPNDESSDFELESESESEPPSGKRRKRGSKQILPMRRVIFPELLRAKNDLENFKKKHILKHMLCWDGSTWLCDEDKLPLIEEGIERWQQEASNTLQLLIESYPDAKRNYRIWLIGWLNSVNADLITLGEDPLDVESLILEYDDKFPSLETVSQLLAITVVGPREVWGLKTQAKHKADLEEALAKFEEAKYSQEQIEALRRGLERDRQAKEEAIRNGAAFIENQIVQALSGVIAEAEGVADSGSLSGRRRKAIEKALNQIQEVMQLPGASAVADLFEESEQLANICQSSIRNRAQIHQRIAELREKISDCLNVSTNANGDGTRVAPTKLSFKK